MAPRPSMGGNHQNLVAFGSHDFLDGRKKSSSMMNFSREDVDGEEVERLADRRKSF